MFSAYALIVATLLGAGARSSSRPSITTPHTVMVQNAASLVASFVADEDFTITSAKWVTHAVGVGLGNETLTLMVADVSSCTITVACLGGAGTEVVSACNVAVLAGQEVEWTRSGCVTAAIGVITYQVRQ